MSKSVIIIPSRLEAKRLPNKPLLKINGVPMIVHVLNKAKQSGVGEVFVATPDKEIFMVVEENGGKAILTAKGYPTGSDRVYEVYLNKLKNSVDLIINLQGDMPNIKPDSIFKLEKLMRDNYCDIGTLSSSLKENEIYDKNIVKVHVGKKLEKNSFLEAKDFFREPSLHYSLEKIYHHIGIYAFTSAALTKYVKLPRSKVEIKRNLEQWRALENNMLIKVGLSDSAPLSIDTEEDFLLIKKSMEYKS